MLYKNPARLLSEQLANIQKGVVCVYYTNQTAKQQTRAPLLAQALSTLYERAVRQPKNIERVFALSVANMLRNIVISSGYARSLSSDSDGRALINFIRRGLNKAAAMVERFYVLTDEQDETMSLAIEVHIATRDDMSNYTSPVLSTLELVEKTLTQYATSQQPNDERTAHVLAIVQQVKYARAKIVRQEQARLGS